MNKFTYVVGDLHGKHEIAEKMLKLASPDTQVVFVGDYLDSYDRSSKDCVHTLLLVSAEIEAAERSCKMRKDREPRVVGLRGNHEMSYLQKRHRCSGWNPDTQIMVNHLIDLIDANFRDYHWVGDFLITHAGVSANLVGQDANKDKVMEFLYSPEADNIGEARGGYAKCGGIYWCDWNEEFMPIDDVPQVMGHTRGSTIRQKGNSYCIDCLESGGNSVLLIKDGKNAEIVNLEDL